MIDIRLIRENKEEIERHLSRRGEEIKLDEIFELDRKKRELLKKIEELRAERKKISKGPEAREKGRELKDKISEEEKKLKEIDKNLRRKLLEIPNIPSDDTPDKHEIVKEIEKKDFSFEVLPHWDIGKILNILDFEKASNLSGSRFAMLKGYAVRLELALINFFMDENSKKGYKEIITPYLVKEEILLGTGQLPKFEEELYKCEKDNLYLIPTAEVPLGNLFKDEILDNDDLPINLQCFTPCFRREAGSYGKDTKGLIRNHQFHKVELFKFVRPEDSDKEFENMVKDIEDLLIKLQLPYRIIKLPADDLGFSSGKTYDFEVWLPGEDRWLEISSCSNCYDFQSRRTNTRYKKDNKKTELVHTLNGSGLAVGRTVAAILENFQRDDATVVIPEVLRKYLNFDIMKRK